MSSLRIIEGEHRESVIAIIIVGLLSFATAFFLITTATEQSSYYLEGGHSIKTPSLFQQKILESKEKTAVMFDSKTCPVCREMKPYWIELADELYSQGIKLYVLTFSRETATIFTQYNVTATPTFIVFYEGKEVGRWIGGFQGDVKKNMREWIMSMLSTIKVENQTRTINQTTETTPLTQRNLINKLYSILPAPGLLMGLIAGLAASLSPCVFPVLASNASIAATKGKITKTTPIISALASMGGPLVIGLALILASRQAMNVIEYILPVFAGLILVLGIATFFGIGSTILTKASSSRGITGFSFMYGFLAVKCNLPIIAGIFLLVAGITGLSSLTLLLGFSLGISIPVAVVIYGGGRIQKTLGNLVRNVVVLEKLTGVLLASSGVIILIYNYIYL